MANTKNSNKKPKFSPYWIYAIILAVFFGFQIFSGGFGSQTGNQTTPADFFTYLRNGDVKNVEIINNREARVYLTPEAAQKEIHKKSRPGGVLPAVGPVPNYRFEFGDLRLFQEEIKQIEDDNNLEVRIEYKTESNAWGEFLISLLPFILIIGVWIFIMRRMSAGGSGGAGGQIFNIGKSKAKLFDEKTDTKTSFKDVAGLEGAKEEVQEIVDFFKVP
jgi:ATP-dependent Zn protease